MKGLLEEKKGMDGEKRDSWFYIRDSLSIECQTELSRLTPFFFFPGGTGILQFHPCTVPWGSPPPLQSVFDTKERKLVARTFNLPGTYSRHQRLQIGSKRRFEQTKTGSSSRPQNLRCSSPRESAQRQSTVTCQSKALESLETNRTNLLLLGETEATSDMA